MSRLSRWRSGFRIWGECLRSIIPPAKVRTKLQSMLLENSRFEQKENMKPEELRFEKGIASIFCVLVLRGLDLTTVE